MSASGAWPRTRCSSASRTSRSSKCAMLPEDRNVRILCECGLQDCDEKIDVDADDYRHVRDEASWFGLRPDHVIPDLEDVVAEHEGWVVVEKREPVKSALEGR